MDAQLFRLGDHSGAKNQAKGNVGKPGRTADSSTTVSKCTGQVGAKKRSKLVNIKDKTPESTLPGHFDNSGENTSGSDGGLFSNILEHQKAISHIAHQPMLVKNRLLSTPSGYAQSRRTDISKLSRMSTPASKHRRQYIDPLLQPQLDEDEDSEVDDEANGNTDHEEDEDDGNII